MATRREVINQLTGAVEVLSSRLTQGLTNRLFEATPKDTTYAASNWIPSVGLPYRATALPEQSRTVRNALQPTVRGVQIRNTIDIGTYRLQQGRLYIFNAVPYINTLNGGSSTQAPANFVQRSIAQEIAALRGTGIRL